jgi:hypothetical protein
MTKASYAVKTRETKKEFSEPSGNYRKRLRSFTFPRIPTACQEAIQHLSCTPKNTTSIEAVSIIIYYKVTSPASLPHHWLFHKYSTCFQVRSPKLPPPSKLTPYAALTQFLVHDDHDFDSFMAVQNPARGLLGYVLVLWDSYLDQNLPTFLSVCHCDLSFAPWSLLVSNPRLSA